MAITVYLSGHLKEFTRGEAEVTLPGEYITVGGMLDDLWKQYPALRDRILTEQGDIRRHINIFLGPLDVKRLEGLHTPMTDVEVHIFNDTDGG